MYDLTIPRRIVSRRETRGLAGYQLAKMAGISPSYLSLIESGQKLPSESVAVRLAEALGDDPELYRAWVETADDHDLEARVDRLQRMRQVRSGSKGIAGGWRPQGMHEWQARRAGLPLMTEMSPSARDNVEPFRPSRSIDIPLLREGTDPARADRDAPESSFALDSSLLPDDHDADRLFAYRASAAGAQRVQNLVAPGDVLVFSRDPRGIDPYAIYAVRYRGSILLTRIAFERPTLILTGVGPAQSPILLTVDDERSLLRLLAGVVVAGVRSLPLAPPLDLQAREPVLGRSGQLDDGHIVRDCEWKEHYGWRPVQRADDMDYLIANPDKTIRYRLLRDEKVKYVLKLNAEQWQQALGDYYDGPTWYRNGYIVAITKKRSGEYTEEFQDRWAAYVREAESSERGATP